MRVMYSSTTQTQSAKIHDGKFQCSISKDARMLKSVSRSLRQASSTELPVHVITMHAAKHDLFHRDIIRYYKFGFSNVIN